MQYRKRRKISKYRFSLIKKIMLFDIYYYDGMLISEPGVSYKHYFDKAECEHLANHIHLDDYMDCLDLTKEDFSAIAKLLFYRLKGMYPDVKFIVYWLYDDDDMPILDFGAIREGEMIYPNLDSEPDRIEYFINEGKSGEDN